MFPGSRFVFLLWLTASYATGSQTATEQSAFRGWPDSWVDAYQRFEAFIDAKERLWQRSEITFSDGQIFHGVRSVETSRERVRLFRYHNRFLNAYAVCGRSSSVIGYQHHLPIVWYRELNETMDVTNGASINPGAKYEIIPPPQSPSAYWPNERLLLFLDFHVFPGNNPNDILKENSKITPSVHLLVHDDGTVERSRLEDQEMEALLEWRLYFDGKLVEDRSGASRSRLSTFRGTGNYKVMIGVEGPSGFMPVSNIVDYPLFAEGADNGVVYPKVTNPNGFPDFLVRILSTEFIVELRTGWVEDDMPIRRYSKKTVYGIADPGTYEDPKNQRLVDLWMEWAYRLWAGHGLSEPRFIQLD